MLAMVASALGVIALLWAGLLPGVHALLGQEHHQHGSCAGTHPCDGHEGHEDSPEQPDDRECPICVLIAAAGHVGTGLPQCGLGMWVSVLSLDAAPGAAARIRSNDSHAPCQTCGPPMMGA